MASKVYFANLRARTDKNNKIGKIKNLFDCAGLNELIQKDDLTAIKLHFGERGSDGFINPVFVRQVVEKIKGKGAKAFLTDTNTLYSGSRHNAVDHLLTALEHGFDYTVTGAPLIIADGLRSENTVEVQIDKKHFNKVKLAKDIVSADSVIVLSHFKGHEMAGFGGAIKNLAMGGATAVGKKEQHATKIVVDHDKCIGCAKCGAACPEKAISMSEKKANIALNKCIGCGECLTVCPVKATGMNWETDLAALIERITEYGYGVAKAHENRIGYINFLLNITPDCDCVPWSDTPIVPDIGFLASMDPVAIDQASYDLVNKQIGLSASFLSCNCEAGADKFHGLRSHIDGTIQLRYGEEIGMGSREYELITL
ncbi:MAG: 4Fe-4S ferredoxin iron-sulfur binding domain protein [Firmicutes bacterium]|nr:4Fe-4S ferredoxin iron-sulfur binding domain protein [Bacillota bacterium]